jgi:uncharacterized protein YbjQ (UPF0145 family)
MSADASAPIRVFDAGELTLARYTVLKRLWTGSWRSAFVVPAHDDASAAIAALTTEAASVGADGIVNLHCMNDSGGWPSGYFCYGLAIKLR